MYYPYQSKRLNQKLGIVMKLKNKKHFLPTPQIFLSLFFISAISSAQADESTPFDFSNDSGNQINQNAAPDMNPTDGPLLAERRAFIEKLRQAKQQGIGIAPYLAEFGRIQNSIGSNDNANLSSRLNSLRHNLEDQIKRSQYLKTQRPSQLTPNSMGNDSNAIPPPPSPSNLPLPPVGSSDSDNQLLDTIKQRLGGQLPANWQEKLSSPKGQELLKRLQSGQ
jgi:hypothetical protein